MLASHGLSLLLHHQDGDKLLSLLPEEPVQSRIPITMFQILVRILQSQCVGTDAWGTSGTW